MPWLVQAAERFEARVSRSVKLYTSEVSKGSGCSGGELDTPEAWHWRALYRHPLVRHELHFCLNYIIIPFLKIYIGRTLKKKFLLIFGCREIVEVISTVDHSLTTIERDSRPPFAWLLFAASGKPACFPTPPLTLTT